MRAPLRSRSLEEVDAILTARSSCFGVARVAEITRLDELGLPVFSVIRRDPVGESVSVVSGKGDGAHEARVAALAEALERYCAEPRGRIAIVLARADALGGRAVAPSDLIPTAPIPPDATLEWCEGATLEGAPIWVPANAVLFPYDPGPGTVELFSAHTHGLAVGATHVEATVHALLECIERDAYSRAVALASVGRGDEVPILLPASVRKHAESRIAKLERAGLRWLARDLTCDTQVPTVLVTIADGTWSHMGVASHANARLALAHAIDEAAQGRLVDIQGAREDLLERTPGGAHRWFLDACGSESVELSEDSGPPDIDSALAWIAVRLRAIGVDPITVDLSMSDVELAVVRAITPTLATWAADPTRIGSRARRWLHPR